FHRGHFVDCLAEQALQFAAFAYARRPLLIVICHELEQIPILVVARSVFQTAEREPARIHQPSVILLDGLAEFGGDLFLRRRAVQALLGGADGGFDLFRTLTLLAWRPIESAQAIEDRA